MHGERRRGRNSPGARPERIKRRRGAQAQNKPLAPTPSRISGAGMWPTAPAVGSRHTESTLSHVVAIEDLPWLRQFCRPSRGLSGASSLPFSPRLSPWATFLRPPRRASEPGRAYSSAYAHKVYPCNNLLFNDRAIKLPDYSPPAVEVLGAVAERILRR